MSFFEIIRNLRNRKLNRLEDNALSVLQKYQSADPSYDADKIHLFLKNAIISISEACELEKRGEIQPLVSPRLYDLLNKRYQLYQTLGIRHEIFVQSIHSLKLLKASVKTEQDDYCLWQVQISKKDYRDYRPKFLIYLYLTFVISTIAFTLGGACILFGSTLYATVIAVISFMVWSYLMFLQILLDTDLWILMRPGYLRYFLSNSRRINMFKYHYKLIRTNGHGPWVIDNVSRKFL